MRRNLVMFKVRVNSAPKMDCKCVRLRTFPRQACRYILGLKRGCKTLHKTGLSKVITLGKLWTSHLYDTNILCVFDILYTPFFISNTFFSIQSQCCLTFSWTELQMLLSCCLTHKHHHIETLFIFTIFVSMSNLGLFRSIYLWSIIHFHLHYHYDYSHRIMSGIQIQLFFCLFFRIWQRGWRM